MNANKTTPDNNEAGTTISNSNSAMLNPLNFFVMGKSLIDRVKAMFNIPTKGDKIHQEYLEQFYHEATNPPPVKSERQKLQDQIDVIRVKTNTLSHKECVELSLYKQIQSLKDEQYNIMYDAIKVVNTLEAWDDSPETHGDWQCLSIYDERTGELLGQGHDIVQFSQLNGAKFSIEGKPNGDMVYYGAKFKVNSQYNCAEVTVLYNNEPLNQ